MPIEIRQVTIKAEVENKKDSPAKPTKEDLDYKEVNLEFQIQNNFQP